MTYRSIFGVGEKMITSLSKKKEKRRKKGKRGKRERNRKKGKKMEKEGKRWFWLTQENMHNLLGEKIIFFPQGERISYFFLKIKKYNIFSPNSIYQENMHNLFWGKNIIFFIYFI